MGLRRAILRVMPDLIVPLQRIEAAREFLDGRVHRTPTLSSATAARAVEAATGRRVADDRVYAKAEHLQLTGSFKPRGATFRMSTLSEAERRAGVITLSAGNHAQAVALAGRIAGVPVTVLMPEGAVPSKVEACRGYGARVVLHGAHVGETFTRMEQLRDEEGLVFLAPFDDPDVIAGQGTVGLELLEDVPEVDAVVVGVGGGGLISGIAAAIKEQRPSVRIYGVEPERSNAVSLALAAGEIVQIVPASVADGLGAPFAGRWTMAMARRYLDDIVLLDDPTILAGLRFALERMKQVLEPAGAAALAALVSGRIPVRDGDRVAVVLSGGNVAVDRLSELLAAATPLDVPPSAPVPA